MECIGWGYTYVRLLASLHDEQRLSQQHYGNASDGHQDEEHLDEVLTKEHIRLTMLWRWLRRVE